MPSDNLDGDNPCHAHACALQACMQRTLNQDKCTSHIHDLYRCCNRFYERYGAGDGESKPARSTDGCPIPRVVRGKLEGMGEEVRF